MCISIGSIKGPAGVWEFINDCKTKISIENFWSIRKFVFVLFLSEALIARISLYGKCHEHSQKLRLRAFSFSMWRHGGHVGVKNNSAKSLYRMLCCYYAKLNLSDILPLFCTPTWLSHHVSQNQELGAFNSEVQAET